MKTILVTGASSGFGLETSNYFLEKGWRVVATMRTPNAELFPRSENLVILPLDVKNPESIRDAVLAAGPIDVLVNNAGIGCLNAVEGMSLEAVQDLFNTNTIGPIAMIQAVLPQFRERRSGVIINVTSTVTLKSLPLLSVYTATKAAMNAFTESLALELEQFNIRVRVVLPGRAPGTSFAKNAQHLMVGMPEAYNELAQKVFATFAESTDPVTHSKDVAEAVWYAVNEESSPMKIPAGADAIEWANAYKNSI